MQVSAKFGYVRYKKKFEKREGWEVSGWLSPMGSPRSPVNPLKISTPFTVESFREMNSSPRYPDCKSPALSFLVEQCRTQSKVNEKFSRSTHTQNVCLGTEYSAKGLNERIKQKSLSSLANNKNGKQGSFGSSAKSMDGLRDVWRTGKDLADIGSKNQEQDFIRISGTLGKGLIGDIKLNDNRNNHFADAFSSKSKKIGIENKKIERIGEKKANLIKAPEFSKTKKNIKQNCLTINEDFKHKTKKNSKKYNFFSPKTPHLQVPRNEINSPNNTKKLSDDSSIFSESAEELDEFTKSPDLEDELLTAERDKELNEYVSKSPSSVQSITFTQNCISTSNKRNATEESEIVYRNQCRNSTYDSTNNSCETQRKWPKSKEYFNSGKTSSNQYKPSISQAEPLSPDSSSLPPKMYPSSIFQHKALTQLSPINQHEQLSFDPSSLPPKIYPSSIFKRNTLNQISPMSPAPYQPYLNFYSKEKINSNPQPSYIQTFTEIPDSVNQGSKSQNLAGLVHQLASDVALKTNTKASNKPKISLGKKSIKNVKSKVGLLIDKDANLIEEYTINSFEQLPIVKDGIIRKESNEPIEKNVFSFSPKKKKSIFKHNTEKKIRKKKRKTKNKSNKSIESSDSAIKTNTIDSSKIKRKTSSKNSKSTSISRFITNFSFSLLSALSFNPTSIEDNVQAISNEKLEFDLSKLPLFTQPSSQVKLLQKKIIGKKMKIELKFVLKQFTDKYRNNMDEKILKSLINRIRKSLLSEGVKLEIISYLKNAKKFRSKSKIIKDVERILKKRFRNNRRFSVEFSSSQSDESFSISSDDSAEMIEISNRERDLQKYRYELTHIATFKNSGIKRELSIRPDLVELDPVQVHECNFEEEDQEVTSIASQMNWCKYKQMYKFLCTSPVVQQECPKISRKPIENEEKTDYKDDLDLENLEHIANKKKFYNLNDRNICKNNEFYLIETDANLADPSEIKTLEKNHIRKHVNRIRHKFSKFNCQTK